MLQYFKNIIGEEARLTGLPLFQLLGLALFLHLITAWWSIGYHNPDEHFQILEFANYLLGNTTADQLAWEFDARIRPAIQPTLAYGWFSFWKLWGISNPFFWNFSLKTITLLLALLTVVQVTHTLGRELSEQQQKWLWLFSLFLWFMPYLHLRFTAENVGGILFTWSCLLIIKKEQPARMRSYFLAGLLLGFSFFVRFQLAFAIAGLGFWLLLIRGIRWQEIGGMLAGFLVTTLVNFGLDSWFYQEIVFTPWQYFVANIIEDKASGFGIMPWHYYFTTFLWGAGPILGVALLLAFLTGCWQKPRHIIVWCFVPFLMGHQLVGHKELRFLFPFLYFFPFLTIVGASFWWKKIRSSFFKKIIKNTLIGINLLLLVLFSTRLVHSLLDFNEYFLYRLYQYADQQTEKVTIVSLENNPYELLGLELSFYKNPDLEVIYLNNEKEFADWLHHHAASRPVLFYQMGYDFPAPPDGYVLERKAIAFPEWGANYNYYNWQSVAPIKAVYECTAAVVEKK